MIAGRLEKTKILFYDFDGVMTDNCAYVDQNGLESIRDALTENVEKHAIHLDERVRKKALIPINRMLDFSQQLTN